MSETDYMEFSKQAKHSNVDFKMTTYCETLLTRKGQSLQRKTTAESQHTVFALQ